MMACMPTELSPPTSVVLPAAPFVEFVDVRGCESLKENEKSNKTYTVYRLGVRCAGAVPGEWEVYRRYRHFAVLSKDLKAFKCRVPPMPAKNPLSTQDEAFLAQRGRDLEWWMGELANLPQRNNNKDPMRSSAMLRFLTHSPNAKPDPAPAPAAPPPPPPPPPVESGGREGGGGGDRLEEEGFTTVDTSSPTPPPPPVSITSSVSSSLFEAKERTLRTKSGVLATAVGRRLRGSIVGFSLQRQASKSKSPTRHHAGGGLSAAAGAGAGAGSRATNGQCGGDAAGNGAVAPPLPGNSWARKGTSNSDDGVDANGGRGVASHGNDDSSSCDGRSGGGCGGCIQNRINEATSSLSSASPPSFSSPISRCSKGGDGDHDHDDSKGGDRVSNETSALMKAESSNSSSSSSSSRNDDDKSNNDIAGGDEGNGGDRGTECTERKGSVLPLSLACGIAGGGGASGSGMETGEEEEEEEEEEQQEEEPLFHDNPSRLEATRLTTAVGEKPRARSRSTVPKHMGQLEENLERESSARGEL